jgi:hypothetical protein
MAATTIGRTTWTDDDGTGNVGTLLNNAWLQGLYAQIDALWTAQVTIQRTADANVLDASNTYATLASAVLTVHATRAANSAFDLLNLYANSVSQFRVSGDGNVVATGALLLGSSTAWTLWDTALAWANGIGLVTLTDGTNGLYWALLSNAYYDSAWKFFGKGYASDIVGSPVDGSIQINSTTTAGTNQGDAATFATALSFARDGTVTATGGFCDLARTTPMGDWTSVAYDSANFLGDGTTWTVESGDVTTYAYMIIGHTMFVMVLLSSTALDNSNSWHLKIKVPAGKTISKWVRRTCVQAWNNGGWFNTTVSTDNGDTWMLVFRDDDHATQWSSGAAHVRFNTFFEIQ